MAEQIYSGESAPVEIFNAHLAERPEAAAVRLFTGSVPRLKKLGEVALYLQAAELMKRIKESADDLFSSPIRFFSVDNAIRAPQTYNAGGERAVGNALYKAANNKALFGDFGNSAGVSELIDIFASLDSQTAGLKTSNETHFVTNVGFDKQTFSEMLKGGIAVLDGAPDRVISEYLTVTRGSARIRSSAGSFVITRGRFNELLRRG